MQQTLFDIESKTIADINKPAAYKGIYSFHKYWGKKPTESIAYFIEQFSKESDIVLDPFLGSGLISRECLTRNRRFIGIDVNPFSIEHTKFLLTLPDPSEYIAAINSIEKKIKEYILNTYRTTDKKIASHYLWENEFIKNVWIKPESGRSRIELAPTSADYELFKSFDQYEVKNIRDITFYTNSRINSKTSMTIYDLFTKRALHNIDLILNEISKYPINLKRALLLTLTSSSGQMSNMVFAITGRGKTKNLISNKIEVGSWVIGFWRPKLHFEINVWNCFKSRANKLHKTLLEIDTRPLLIQESLETLLDNNSGAAIITSDCLETMVNMPNKSVTLICTDPPHSDRIPYLELSELWNSILNAKVSFEKEIIVSNAKERNKKKVQYLGDMKKLIDESSRVLKDDGMMLLYFNARDKQSWKFLDIVKDNSRLEIIGTFPLEYSATSVVQDNRKGAMKTDYVLVLRNTNIDLPFKHELAEIPGWSNSIPQLSFVD